MFDKLQKQVVQWASDRNLINGCTARDQFHKLIQEAAELSDNLCKGKDVRDDFGDILVVLIIMAKQCNVDLTNCLEIAYEDIKDRKGVMKNGVFIKEESLE
jgi:NTP pyrophosphatase (non-canonical NTP hydrolase)